MRIPRDASQWKTLEAASERHSFRFKEQLFEFRNLTLKKYDEELVLLERKLQGGPTLRPHLAGLAGEVRGYLDWLRWTGGLCSNLGPVFQLVSEADAQRLALSVITYLGARLIDDSVDGHEDFKRKRHTLLGALVRDYPKHPEVVLRTQTALAGFWLLNYGKRRLRASGSIKAADTAEKLFEIIPPGVLVEALHNEPLNEAEYEAVIERKSVSYDMILYRVFLEPAPRALRSRVLKSLGVLSRVAQYLNDLMDSEDDESRLMQVNRLNHCDLRGEAYWLNCLEILHEAHAATADLPESFQDLFGSMAIEVLESATRLWGEEPNQT